MLIAAVLMVLPCALAAQGPPSALAMRLSETAKIRMARDGVAGAVVLVLRQGAPTWIGTFGHADRVTHRPLTKDAAFRVESLSKPVTALGALVLVENGRLDLDAPAGDCLQRWRPPNGTPVFTARQLLSHTAGIGLGDFSERYGLDVMRPDLPDHLDQDFAMVALPGAGFAYSDTGYNLLELMIEDCTGEDFADFITRNVLLPLGMETATYAPPDMPMPVGHDLRGRPVAPYVYPGRGSGGLIATPMDIGRLASASMDGSNQTVLSDAGITALHRPHIAVGGLFGFAADGYAMGHFTETLSDGRKAVWHGGQGYGWMSHMHLVPETGDGLVILSNSQRAWPLFAALLKDWSHAIGVAPVGMTRVLWADTAARIAIVGALGLAVVCLRAAILRRKRRMVWRGTLAGVGAALILWPLWAATQDYLFVFSILPGLWRWLCASSACAGFALAAVALVPARGNKQYATEEDTAPQRPKAT